MKKIGIISDTHGLLRPEAGRVFAECELIIHAGDIGTEEVLDELGRIAPVAAVRGNNDNAGWAAGIPCRKIIDIGKEKIEVVHIFHKDDIPAGSIVVSGHTHRPCINVEDKILFINPGSAGPRRFNLPVTVAILEIDDERKAAIIPLLKSK